MYHRWPLIPLLLLCWSAAVPAAPDEFLPPEQAFPLVVEAAGPEALRLRWEVVEGYYLYRGKFKFATTSPAITLGEAEIPRGERHQDEFFGEVETLRGRIEVRLPLRRDDPGAGRLTLEVTSQGCADAGLCYPPQRQTLEVMLPPPPPAASSAAPAPAGATGLGGGLGGALGGGLLGASFGDDDGIVPAEQAFRLEVTPQGGEGLRLAWQVAPGTFLYQEKLRISLLEGEGVALGDYRLPPSKLKKDAVRPDGSIGDLQVYDTDFAFDIPLQRSRGEATRITLEVAFQGCAEIGICYPPRQERVTLELPAGGSPAATPSGTAASTPSATTAITPPTTPPVSASSATTEAPPLSEQDRMLATLQGGNLWLVLSLFFIAGLLLALTPCVFPMIPILSGIIAGQGRNITARQGFVLSSVYVLAMALTYTAAGVLAGMFGQNLQAAFQDPWVLSLFAAVFVALSLSMFGFYELQLPAALQSRLAELSNRQQGGTLIGVAIMGLLSALIVGPCVAPPLAGALIYIGQTGDAVLGGLALFGLSMGMGAPLILIGTSAGRLLPRAGAWMDTVKAVFGVGMLAVAIVLLERILPPAVSMLLWGALLICSAIYMGALRDLPVEASGWARLWKGIGFALLVYGSLMLVGAAAGGKDTVQPLRGLAFAGTTGGGAAQGLNFTRVKGTAELDRQLAAAQAAGRPVMLDFYADWCVSCKELERYTFSDPGVIAALDGFVLLKADVTADDADDRALLQGRFGMPGPPAIIFWGADGVERKAYRVVGFVPATEFAAHVRRAVQ
jgi:thioredoxin:protein disulfide reductase